MFEDGVRWAGEPGSVSCRMRVLSHLRFACLFLVGVVLTGCADLGFYAQSVSGHLAIMRAAQPVQYWLADPQASAELKARLALSLEMRRFASTDLALPDNASYQQFADLKRSYAVWNVTAAPVDALTLKTWCFPVAGCVGYRGYFDEGQARALAAELQTEGLEVSVHGVPAYSTLGWLNWAGGDPLLSTFIQYPEGELARLMFHELAHQVLYVSGDTVFNESFATAVERAGGQRWLERHGSPKVRQEYAIFDGRRKEFLALLRSTRQALAALYAGQVAVDQRSLILAKGERMQQFHQDYARLRKDWLAAGATPASLRGYDDWVMRANNASLGAVAAYDDLVPAFEALFAREFERVQPATTASDRMAWVHIYAEVRRLAALGPELRQEALAKLISKESLHG